ncbi:permease [Actinobacillus minor 202]|uniref:Probable membrane transporter protein n=1 Tax=Actinobacillus minor 202 TaxID=591023 RepID=A0ABP2GT39_9PAST|nr:sulfite exporter TauE/SafE family protein [Actinobacillus minor]EEV24742.1 permease [Actinobacillus minor 202]
MTLTTLLILMCCGVLTNIMSALFGIGGGVLMVPILHTLFPEFPLQMVAATSLTTVMGTALINLISFYKQKISVELKPLLLWSVGMIVGVQLGFELSFYFPNFLIITIFISTLLVLAWRSFLAKKGQNQTASTANEKLKGVAVCFLGGGIAGITGIGGGSIMAPLLGLLPSIKPGKIAVYSNSMMLIGGLGNLYGYLSKAPPFYLEGAWQIGYVNFSVVAIVVFCSFLTSFISIRLKGYLPEALIQKGLGVILLVIAAYMAVLQLWR